MIRGVRKHSNEIFVILKIEEVKREWRKEHNEEFLIADIVKSSRMKFGGYRNA